MKTGEKDRTETKAVGRTLRRAREIKGLTMAAVATAAGIDTSELCRIELGQRSPRIDLLNCLIRQGLEFASLADFWALHEHWHPSEGSCSPSSPSSQHSLLGSSP